MRYLSIDLGEKRTGLAVGDAATGLCAPLKVLSVPRGPRLLDELAKVIAAEKPGAIVIGLPVNMDGTEGAAARSVREFGAALGERIGTAVQYQDERLTSYAAEQHLHQSGRTHKQKKQIRDALAAAEILRDYLTAQAGG